MTRCLKLIPLLLLSLVSIACTTDKQVISQAADVHQQIEPAVITDQPLQTYVQQVGDRIVQAAREDRKDRPEWMFDNVEFHLVNSQTLNAFTTGGKHVYLYLELFTSCDSEDAFAAVVAHEFGHIYGRHVQAGMDRQYAILGGAAAAAIAGLAVAGEDNRLEGAAIGGAVGLGAGQFLGLGFTRDDEYEADELGFRFYVRAGYEPQKFANFFRLMIEQGHDSNPEITSSHPKLANRVKRVDGWVRALPSSASQYRKPQIVGSQRFEELQARAQKVAKRMPQDKSLEAAQLTLQAFPSCVAPEDLPEQKQAQQRIIDTLQRGKRK